MSLKDIREKLEKQDLEKTTICLWKVMSKDKDSSTFKDVKDDSHKLYKCYDCLGVGMNVCEYFAPRRYNINKINGDYR